MKYAILCPPATGHLNPFMTIARELESRGHEVIFYQLLDYQNTLEKHGFQVRTFAHQEFPLGEWKRGSEKLATMNGPEALEFTIQMFRRKTKCGLQELPELLKADGIEAIVADQAGLESSTVAEVLNIPFVTVCNALPMDFDPSTPPFFTPWKHSRKLVARMKNYVAHKLFEIKMQKTLQLVNEGRTERALKPLKRRAQAYSQRLRLLQLPETIDFPRTSKTPTFWIGPLINNFVTNDLNFPWEKLNGKPLVYISMGSEMNQQPHVFQTLIDGLREENLQILVSLGRKGSDLSKINLRDEDLIFDYVPQTEILKKCSLFVTHGGMNSTLEGLAQGVPLLVLPQTSDQFGIAARVEHFELGKMILKKDFHPAFVRETYRDLSKNSAIKQRVQEFARKNTELRPQSTAVDLIEKHLN